MVQEAEDMVIYTFMPFEDSLGLLLREDDYCGLIEASLTFQGSLFGPDFLYLEGYALILNGDLSDDVLGTWELSLVIAFADFGEKRHAIDFEVDISRKAAVTED